LFEGALAFWITQETSPQNTNPALGLLRCFDLENPIASPLSFNKRLTPIAFSAYSLFWLGRRMTDYRTDSQNITTEQVAKILGISKKTLKTWLQNGKVPEPDRNPKNNYRIWTLTDVDAIRRILGNEGE
jgi:predicted DNA-binding transcriptional regulator AlpA